MKDDLTRAELLRRGVAGAAALSVPGLLAACGGSSGSGGAASTEEVKKVMNFANWPYYIDTPQTLKTAGIDKPTTLKQFEAKTGIKVNYYEEVNDNPGYFAKVQGRLSKGQGIGRDIIVSTDNDRPLGEYISNKWDENHDKSIRRSTPTASSRSLGRRAWTASRGTTRSPTRSRPSSSSSRIRS